MWPTVASRRNLTGQSSVYLDRQLMPLWNAYVEYSGAFPQRGGPEHVIGFGASYKLTPHQLLDFHCDIGFSAASPDHCSALATLSAFRLFGLGDSVRVLLTPPPNLEVPGNIDHHDALVSANKKKEFQQLSPLVVFELQR